MHSVKGWSIHTDVQAQYYNRWIAIIFNSVNSYILIIWYFSVFLCMVSFKYNVHLKENIYKEYHIIKI